VVSRSGRPHLVGPALERVTAPTLLIVGGADTQVLALKRQAVGRLAAPHGLEVVPGAGQETIAIRNVIRQRHDLTGQRGQLLREASRPHPVDELYVLRTHWGYCPIWAGKDLKRP
jgi:hypothetical protein